MAMMQRTVPRGRSGEAGQVISLVAIGLTLLVSMIGLATDAGFLFYFRRQAQAAADAGAGLSAA